MLPEDVADFLRDKAQQPCVCDEPEPGESGVIECDRCIAIALLRRNGEPIGPCGMCDDLSCTSSHK